MRIIKFRAWDKHFKEMASIICLNIGQFSEDHILKSKSHPYTYNQKFENVILMQFTGLHDKNGREIYEGDIVRVDELTFGRGERLPEVLNVVFYQDAFEFFRGDHPLMGLRVSYLKSGEVIGNIHENPELLSGKEALKEGGGR